jgi:uncharacterized RDD family membrane protein YckC
MLYSDFPNQIFMFERRGNIYPMTDHLPEFTNLQRSETPNSGDLTPDKQSTDVVADRVVAQVVDTVVLTIQLSGVVLLLEAFLWGYLESVTTQPGDVILPIAALTFPLYGGILEAYWNGQTIGKRLMNIEVVTHHGQHPSFDKALLRNLPAIAAYSFIILLVGLVAIAKSDRRQRVFDRLAKTYVIRS